MLVFCQRRAVVLWSVCVLSCVTPHWQQQNILYDRCARNGSVHHQFCCRWAAFFSSLPSPAHHIFTLVSSFDFVRLGNCRGKSTYFVVVFAPPYICFARPFWPYFAHVIFTLQHLLWRVATEHSVASFAITHGARIMCGWRKPLNVSIRASHVRSAVPPINRILLAGQKRLYSIVYEHLTQSRWVRLPRVKSAS